MRNVLLTLSAGLLLVGGVTFSAFAQDKEKKTVEGELIDTYCYSAGGASGEKHASCAAKCAKSGIPAGVLVDGKAWTLATNPKPLADSMAKMVRVTGAINEETHTVVPDKIEVKDGDSWKEIKLKDAHHGGSEEGEKKEEK